MKKTILYSTIAGLLISAAGCKKNPPAPTPTPPAQATLSEPANNTLCVRDPNATNGQGTVTLKWAASSNTDTYEVIVKNLLTNAETKQSTNQTQWSVALAQNTPYSWKVVSKNNQSSATATSAVWKFYNSGSGVSNHSPFPAEASSPAMGATVTPTNNSVTLSWAAVDPDGTSDLKDYDIYISNSATLPTTATKANHTTLSYAATVAANTTYYWKVVTRDLAGNTSHSPTWTFKTN